MAKLSRFKPNISNKGLISQLRAYVPIMIPLIINSILMAENLSISMANRGFGANERWTSMNDIRMRTTDYLVLLAGVLLTAATVYLRFVPRLGLL